ncbi:cbb3-type cytochrome c oxidase subunit I [Sporomusa sp.]|uniref:cbb3-type cytochrome c oxidase subunit I n=1 Tax=Sporomusa sp. TaxID=2078658 RepID=UPI002BF7300B|nr:cbb3-type cytochrome c oxidase subunit I [Sporomusa sp.]HWR07922.1 cbb3-type cytochrome c oxidase subunit I [Sporomusa sp.]
MFRSQHLSYKYALVAYLFFGLQGVVASGGAIELVFPDIALPISYSNGRAFHLNISMFWPLIGMIGAIYFFFCQEAGREIYSFRLIDLNFWLLTGTVGLILGSLLLGFNEGREYLEAIWPLKLAIAASVLLLGYNLVRTYLLSGVPRGRATLISILAGSFTLIIFYVPNILSYSHPTVDEITKFLVVHLWEEMSLELIGTGVLSALLIKVTGAERRVVETAIYLEITFAALAGILATGHHYYWIGVPAIWLWIGGIFSAMQVLPVLLLLYTAVKSAKFSKFSSLSYRDKITTALVGCSMFYHISGAGFLGLFMAYPPLNRFVHGTYITSAHSHFALFGVFGFLVLAICFYMLFTEVLLTPKMYRWCWIALLALNSGLLTMGLGLLLAGGLQAYCWRVIGLSIGDTNQLIRPYLFIRMFGGLIYSGGSILLTFIVVKSIWSKLRVLFHKNGKIAKLTGDDLNNTQKLLHCLVQKEKEAELLLIRIKYLSDRLRR